VEAGNLKILPWIKEEMLKTGRADCDQTTDQCIGGTTGTREVDVLGAFVIVVVKRVKGFQEVKRG